MTFLLLSPTLKNGVHLTYYVKVGLRACLSLLSLCKTKYPICRALLGVVRNLYTITRGCMDLTKLGYMDVARNRLSSRVLLPVVSSSRSMTSP